MIILVYLLQVIFGLQWVSGSELLHLLFCITQFRYWFVKWIWWLQGPLNDSLVAAVRPHSILRTNPYCKKIFSRGLLKKWSRERICCMFLVWQEAVCCLFSKLFANNLPHSNPFLGTVVQLAFSWNVTCPSPPLSLGYALFLVRCVYCFLRFVRV